MAVSPRSVFSSFTGFFVPNYRRRREGGGKPEDPALQQFLESFDAAFAEVATPVTVQENITDDLKSAFKVKAAPRSGYEPGNKGVPTSINIVDFFSDPTKATWKTVSSVFSTRWADLYSTPADEWLESDKEILKRLEKVWVAGGAGVIPYSLTSAFSQWAGAANLELTRRIRDVRKNPGYTYMLANKLKEHYRSLGINPKPIGGLTLDEIVTKSKAAEDQITGNLLMAESLKSVDFNKSTEYYNAAHKRQSAWEKESGDYRKDVDRLFGWHADGGALDGTPEAQFRRYFRNRNLHYQTLNFLRTWKEDGIPGVFSEYVWKQVIQGHVFKKGTWRYNLYLPNLIGGLQEKTIGRLIEPLVNKLYKVRARFVDLRNKYLKKISENLLKFIGEKLGLKALATWVGTVLAPGAGTAVGAVIGAALQFFAGEIAELLGGAAKLVFYAVVGVVAVFAVFVIGIVILFAVVLGNHPYPWEKSAVATGLDCNTTAPAPPAACLNEISIAAANSWGAQAGENVKACLGDVVAQCKAAGVDPAICAAVWLHESGASTAGDQDFGIPSAAGAGFSGQLSAFINNFAKNVKINWPACFGPPAKDDTEGFFRAFCTAGRQDLGVDPCPNLNELGQACVDDFLLVYGWVSCLK